MSNEMERFRQQWKNFHREAQQLDLVKAQANQVSGQVRVNGAGESQVFVQFPVKFTDKPLISFGAELQENEPVVSGSMPTISIVVLDWQVEERPPTSRLYTGATLGIVTGGAKYNKFIVHWHANGTAYTNPV